MATVPQLTDRPTRHPQCCASLSLPLLALLDAALPRPPSVTLSVGSGPGLLEALLLACYPSRAGVDPVVSFYGVEVVTPAEPVNRFLPSPNAVVVLGTWAVAREADAAEGLLFVYPRQETLIAAYLTRATSARVAVWVGPRCDVGEMTVSLRQWGEEDEDKTLQAGSAVEEGEAVMVFRRRYGR